MAGEPGPMGNFSSRNPDLDNSPGSNQSSDSEMDTESEVSHEEIVIEAVVHTPADTDTDSGSQRPNPVAKPPAAGSVSPPADPRNSVTVTPPWACDP